MKTHQRQVVVGLFLFIGIVMSLSFLWFFSTRTARLASSTPLSTNLVIPESPDFATLVLRDAWDMSEFSDISQYLNRSGQEALFTNISVQNGVFYATTANVQFPIFSLLFPGYYPATIHVGKDGAIYPIPTAYACLSFAMKTSSSTGYFIAQWLPDPTLQGGGNSVGTILGPADVWHLYQLDLSASTANGTPWSSQPSWQGLFLNPTTQLNTPFEIDWIRLTPCTPQLARITWTPNSSVDSLWISPENSGRAIYVGAIQGSSGSYQLDTQGLPPGIYAIGLGNSSTPVLWTGQSLGINQTPIINFDRPSFTSGEDYATTTGNAWDFSDTSDVKEVLAQAEPKKLQWSFQKEVDGNGYLDLVTQSGTKIFDPDVQVKLNVPIQFNGNTYRYLSFRMYTEWSTAAGVPIPWANGPKGMIARWVWSIPSLSQPTQGYACTLVSQDIPYDIGWQTYTIDLFDTFNGQPEELSPAGTPHCPSSTSSINWSTSANIMGVRFDPNENVSQHPTHTDLLTGGGPFHQKIDWIKLTKPDRAKKGQSFPIQISVNKTMQQSQFALYYTTDPQQPTQNNAVVSLTPPPTPVPVAKVFLPVIARQVIEHAYSAPMDTQETSLQETTKAKHTHTFSPEVSTAQTQLTFWWDTSSVAPARYYICAVANDGYNTSTYCSQAPMDVVQ